jgi:proline iminopeptidase
MDASPRSRRSRDERARLAVRQVGVGHPIVALHGGPDFDYEYLLPEIDRLADLGQLVLYAQRGRGARTRVRVRLT